MNQVIDAFSNRFESKANREKFINKVNEPGLSDKDMAGVFMNAFTYWYKMSLEKDVVELNDGYMLPNAASEVYQDIFDLFNSIASKIESTMSRVEVQGVSRIPLYVVPTIEKRVWQIQTSCGNGRAYIIDTSKRSISIKGKVQPHYAHISAIFAETTAVSFETQDSTSQVFHLPTTNPPTPSPTPEGSAKRHFIGSFILIVCCMLQL